jgi:hypothetical protein
MYQYVLDFLLLFGVYFIISCYLSFL